MERLWEEPKQNGGYESALMGHTTERQIVNLPLELSTYAQDPMSSLPARGSVELTSWGCKRGTALSSKATVCP